jgi:hypothetical protein
MSRTADVRIARIADLSGGARHRSWAATQSVAPEQVSDTPKRKLKIRDASVRPASVRPNQRLQEASGRQ